MYEVIIVGGGIAGLSAALILGRCRRRVLVIDSGRPRNGASRAMHGFLSRDGIDPWEMRRLGREQLRQYPSVELLEGEAVDAECLDERFSVTLKDGTRFSCRILLLATGIVDRLPEVEGAASLYGRGLYHCPYCDGWEHRDLPLAIYGRGREGVLYALELKSWSDDLVLCTDGDDLVPEERERLARHGVGLRTEKLLRLEGGDGGLERLVFDGSDPLPRRALFFLPAQEPHSDLASRLGCTIVPGGVVETGSLQRTEVPGLYLAGDAARSVKLAIVAAAEGVEAAYAINTALHKADFD